MLQALLLAGIAAKLALSAALPPRSDVSTQVLAPRVDIWQPAVGSKFQVILNGVVTSVDPSIQVIDIDLFNTPAETIKSLKEVSFKQVICYINAGGSENWRPDYGRFPPEAIGAALLKGGGTQWAGENWVDIRHPVVVDILKERIRLAADKGCNGVDLDNVDGYQIGGATGFPLTQGDAVNFIKTLAAEAHSRGLGIGLKNSQDILYQVSGDIQFAVNEECAVYNECGFYADFTSPKVPGVVPKPVFHIEYIQFQGTQIVADAARFQTYNVDQLRKTLCLQEPGQPNYGLSSVIATQNLDAWTMECDGGRVYTTFIL